MHSFRKEDLSLVDVTENSKSVLVVLSLFFISAAETNSKSKHHAKGEKEN